MDAWGDPGSVQPHIPSFPAIPAKTKGEEAALPLARFMPAGSAAAAGQPCSPPPPPPAAPLLPRLQEGWSRALCLGSGGGTRCRSTGQTWATWTVLFPLQSCCHGACVSHSPEGRPRDNQRCCKALGCPSAPACCPRAPSHPALPPSLPGAPLPSPCLRRQHPEEHRAALGFGNLIRAVPQGGCLCSALGSQLPRLPGRCQGCRAGSDSAAACLWASAELLCAVEKGRECRGLEKGPYKHRQ